MNQDKINKLAFLLYTRDENYFDDKLEEGKIDWEGMLGELDKKDGYWGEGKHFGDCTDVITMCLRCCVENYFKDAKRILEILNERLH